MNWDYFFNLEKNKDYYKKLINFLDEEYINYCVNPLKENIFKAFELTTFENTKVVIIGQDPYPNIKYATGLAFSVNKDCDIPKSLLNIFKELKNDLNINIPNHGDLTKWAIQGVLLLNRVLTVRRNEANSHKNKGWEEFTLNIVKYLNDYKNNLVFLLWGNNAINLEKYIDNKKHFIIKSAHPSPLSYYRGFENSKPFSRCNNYLKSKNLNQIDFDLN